jgi:hypothetical protein
MARKKIFPALFWLVIILLLVACARGAATEERTASEIIAFDGDEAAGGAAPQAPESVAEEPASEAAFNTQTQAQERLIIRTANLSIVVADTEEAMATIARMAEENEGWIVSSNVFQYSEEAKTGSITVRVPAAGFNSAINAIKALAVEVSSESTTGQDVTEEFVDLSARLANLEATADRVRSFLDEANNVEDALAVNMELSRLEGEIEALKGRIQYLSQSAAFSTITVNLTPDVLAQPITVGGWRPQGVARDALEALVEALQGVASFLIWAVIYLLPLGLLIGIPLWLIIRGLRRWRRRRQATLAPTPAE